MLMVGGKVSDVSSADIVVVLQKKVVEAAPLEGREKKETG